MCPLKLEQVENGTDRKLIELKKDRAENGTGDVPKCAYIVPRDEFLIFFLRCTSIYIVSPLDIRTICYDAYFERKV